MKSTLCDLAARYFFEEKLIFFRRIPFGQLSRQRPIPDDLVQLTLDTCIKVIEEDEVPAITFSCGFLAVTIKDKKYMLD